MRAALLIAYGNPLCGDDAAGPQIARLLQQETGARSGVPLVLPLETMELHQLGPELAPLLGLYDRVILIDASRNLPAGCVASRRLRPDGTLLGPLGHHLRPEALLALAETLYGPLPPCWLVEVGGSSFEPGDEMSGPVRAALPAALNQVRELLAC